MTGVEINLPSQSPNPQTLKSQAELHCITSICSGPSSLSPGLKVDWRYQGRLVFPELRGFRAARANLAGSQNISLMFWVDYRLCTRQSTKHHKFRAAVVEHASMEVLASVFLQSSFQIPREPARSDYPLVVITCGLRSLALSLSLALV